MKHHCPLIKIPGLEYAKIQIDQLSNSSNYATFGISTNSSNIINGLAQQQHLLEKQLINLISHPTLFKSLFNQCRTIYQRLLKSLFMFLLEPLNINYKTNLVASLKQSLTNSTKICEVVYDNHIETTIQAIDKIKLRFEQLNEISRWKTDEEFHKKVTKVTDKSMELLQMIFDVIRGGHSERIDAIATCVAQLELSRNSIHQINLHKLTKTISIHSNIGYIKTRLKEKSLSFKDLHLLISKLDSLEGWLLALEIIHVDTKSNYDDIKQLLKQCQQNIEKRDFDWEELEMTMDTLELFLIKLKTDVMASAVNILKSTLHKYNTLITDAKKTKNKELLFNDLGVVFSNLNKIAALMSLLATDEEQANELLFSAEKLNFVSTQILAVVQHWYRLNCVKNCSLYYCMIDFLSPLWHKMYYKYLADLHVTTEFDGYYALLEDIYFSAAKEAIRSISTGNAELFQSKSASVIALLDYMLCYVRDKSYSEENNDHTQVIINKIKSFRAKYVRKLYQGISWVHHFMVTNPTVMLPEKFLEKFERTCSNNLMQKINTPLDKLTNNVPSDTLKLLVEQIYDNRTGSDVTSSKISINNVTCSIEYNPCVCFVVINEFGNAVLDVKTFHIEDIEIINFLKCVTPNTLLVVSIINPTNIKIPDHLIDYFTLIDCQILSKFQKHSPKNNEIYFDGAILVGHLSKHRYIHWYHEQLSYIGPTKTSHIYNANIPNPLSFFEVTRIDIRHISSSSNPSMGLSSYMNNSAGSPVSIIINGVEYMKPINSVVSEETSNLAGYGYCYVFENLENPQHGNLIQIKLSDIEEFVSGLTMGSVCCFVFPHGIGDHLDSVSNLFGMSNSTDLYPNDNLAGIFVNKVSKKKGDNFRYVKVDSSTPIHMSHYLNTNQEKNMELSLFVDNTPNMNLTCGTDSQNNIHNLIKKVKKQDGDKINKLNKEFDLLQSDFLSQLRKVSLISAHDTLASDENSSLNTSLNSENSVIALAKKISFLVSYIVDITRNEGPILTDQDILNNCREIKRLGEGMITLCCGIANQCQRGTTKSEITNLTEELPLFLQQLLVISKVNYGSVYYGSKGQSTESDATQMASSLLVSSTNILKTVISLLKLTHSAKVQYKLNIDINSQASNNNQSFMSIVKNLQDSIQKPSTL